VRIGRPPSAKPFSAWRRETWSARSRTAGTFVTDVNITDLARITEVRVVPRERRQAARTIVGADREALSMLVEVLEDGRSLDPA